jgi:hypothetical protein
MFHWQLQQSVTRLREGERWICRKILERDGEGGSLVWGCSAANVTQICQWDVAADLSVVAGTRLLTLELLGLDGPRLQANEQSFWLQHSNSVIHTFYICCRKHNNLVVFMTALGNIRIPFLFYFKALNSIFISICYCTLYSNFFIYKFKCSRNVLSGVPLLQLWNRKYVLDAVTAYFYKYTKHTQPPICTVKCWKHQ